MRVSRYRPVVYLQLFLLFVDIFINSFGELFRTNNVVQLVIFIIQDVCLLLALIALFLVFINTFIFQAGLIFLLVRKFKTTILFIVIYLLLSVALHIWTMSQKWGGGLSYIQNNGLQALYALQRLTSTVYYFTYKRTMIKLADPRYYSDSEWLRKEFSGVT